MYTGRFPGDYRKLNVCVCMYPTCTVKKPYLGDIQSCDPFPEDAADVKSQKTGNKRLDQGLLIFAGITRA